jgi:glycosyltransferase involved in cell wall biosynthesis
MEAYLCLLRYTRETNLPIRIADVSVIIPTLNGELRIASCLSSIFFQDAQPREVIVVDDKSTDGTIDVCKSMGVSQIHVSGKRDIEYSKKIGISAAQGKYILFLDDDNQLPSRTWIDDAVKVMDSDPEIGALQTLYFSYRQSDPAANRYCSLMGLNDPVVFHLNRTDRLAYWQDGWEKDCLELKDFSSHQKVLFDPTRLPTLGSQGFLSLRSSIQQFATTERFLHLDYSRWLANSSRPYFALTRDSIIHDHCTSTSQFVGKCIRNAKIYLNDAKDSVRTYDYELTPGRVLRVGVLCLTFVWPTMQAFRGYLKVRDRAWFLHPILSFWVFVRYAILKSRSLLSNLIKTNTGNDRNQR